MNIEEMLKNDEGTGVIKNGRFMPYRCTAGKLTIGYGRNLDDRGISKEEAEFMLQNDIKSCREELLKNLAWYPSLDDSRKNVLINMCFNLGIKGLLQFKNTLQLIGDKKYKEAAQAMRQSLWYKQVAKRAERLCKIMEG